MRTIIIDNYDSFTYNLSQLVAEVNGAEPLVVRNDELSWPELAALGADNLIISPGPGHPANPRDFGICRAALLEATVPVLGVCLGHQGLATAYGGRVTHAPEPMHGRLSLVQHAGDSLFAGLPARFAAVRYHSLIVAEPLPACLQPLAWTSEGLLMALRHRQRPLWGVQFHPESIASEHGLRLLLNFRALTDRHRRQQRPDSRRQPLVKPPQPTRSDLPPAAGAPAACAVLGGEAGSSAQPDQAAGHSANQRPPLRLWSRRLALDCSPEQAFVYLFGQQPYAFWLDSSRAEPGLARFSFIGAASGPTDHSISYDAGRGEITEHHAAGRTTSEGIFAYLQRNWPALHGQDAQLPFDFVGGWVGYLGYEAQRDCGGPAGHRADQPDAWWLFVSQLIAFDHQEGGLYLVCLEHPGQAERAQALLDALEQQLRALPPLEPVALGCHPQPIDLRLARSWDDYCADIGRCQRYIADGESYEICLTNRIDVQADLDPLALYRVLRRVNPAPYAAFLRFGELAVLCSSPERFLRIERDGWVESKPIKGTSRRGATPEQDAALRAQLCDSPKNRSENLMIVDLLRNDLGRVCRVGSVHVPKLMQIESYQTVHQLVSTIRGRLRAGLGPLDCLRAAFPGGSMTGAPKLRTTELIATLEHQSRGIYAGTLGYLGLSGGADLNIVIRTIVLTPGRASIGSGGAVVALSDPQDECSEMLLKARAPLQAILELARGAEYAQACPLEDLLRAQPALRL